MEFTKRNIFRGPTFKGLLSFFGLALTIFGIIIISQSYIAFGIFLIINGIFCFLNIKGTKIDLKKQKVKPYFIYVFFKLGKHYNLKEFDKILVSVSKESVRMNSRATSGDYKSKFHNVYLISTSKKRILLKQFSKNKQAEVFKNEMAKILNL